MNLETNMNVNHVLPVGSLDVIMGTVLVKAKNLVQSLSWCGQGPLPLLSH